MTLAFSQQINGEPTHFVEKIWASLPKLEVYSYDWIQYSKFDALRTYPPKNHTIREDKSDRWHAGRDIHFVINNRTPKRLQFAPVVKCVNTQKIRIYHYHRLIEVEIDGKLYGTVYHRGLDNIYEYTWDLVILAKNDGFESLEDFCKYFNKDFTGKIIHWTSLMY